MAVCVAVVLIGITGQGLKILLLGGRLKGGYGGRVGDGVGVGSASRPQAERPMQACSPPVAHLHDIRINLVQLALDILDCNQFAAGKEKLQEGAVDRAHRQQPLLEGGGHGHSLRCKCVHVARCCRGRTLEWVHVNVEGVRCEVRVCQDPLLRNAGVLLKLQKGR